jgi:hypothetical protein
MPSSSNVHEENSQIPLVVKMLCKIMFDVMLNDLGLSKARYNSHTHEDGEVSSIVTFYTSTVLCMPLKFL